MDNKADTVAPDRIGIGIGLILASVAVMAFSDAIIKLVSSDLTVWQVFATRSLIGLPCLLLLACVGSTSIRPQSAFWVFVRSLLLVMTWLLYYASLPVLSLSVAAVVIYTNPIITTLLSAKVLGERVSFKQWTGVCVGFTGVLIVLRPGSDAFSWYVLLPLLGAFFYSTAMVLTRSTCRNENATTLAVGIHIMFIITGVLATAVLLVTDLDPQVRFENAFVLGDWQTMNIVDWGLMAMLGVLSAAFFMGVARAYQLAPPQIIATFDYGYLVSAAIWAWVFFAEEPTVHSVLGMVLITVAGIMVAHKSKGE